MFELVFLGTSAAAPSIYRGLSSTAILAGEERFLVDCGEGTQRQILRSGIGFKRLNRILLTHAHLDHILGLGGLVSTFTRWESLDELFIWGSEQTLSRVDKLVCDVALSGHTPPIPIHMLPVQNGLVYRGRNFTVQAFPVVHRGRGSLGYVFQEDDHVPFLVEKAEALGIAPGPERGRLVRGETITLADGTVITPDKVLGKAETGVKVVFTGDIARLDLIADIAENADVLVTEATFMHAEADIAQQFGHITAAQAAEFAKEMNIRHLLLTHVSRRYREYDIVKEATAIFPNTIVVRDLEQYAIRRGGTLEKIASA